MSGREGIIRVLHVDDEPDFADLAETYLEREDDRLSVRTTTNAEDGLAILASEDVDCIVSDYDMPGRNGIEFLQTVRTEHPDLPFILYTGKGSEEVASEAISAGVTDYLQKETGTEQFALLANRIANAVTEHSTREFERVAMHTPLHLLNRIFDGFMALDPEWRFTYVNEEAEEIFGAPAEDLLGENIWERFPEATETPFHEKYHHAMETNESQTIEEYFAPWDRWYREHLYPSEEGLSVLFRDITERKKREQDLEQTNVLLSTLIETLPVGVLAEDENRKVLTANDRFFDLFDIPGSPEEHVGSDCKRLAKDVSEQFQAPDAFVERINELVSTRTSTRNEELALADGRTFARDHEPIELPAGEGYLWVYRDITERKERARQRDTTIKFLQRLYDVATDRTEDVDEKITRLLEIGPEHLDLPSGYLTRITVTDDPDGSGIQRVVQASGDHELLQPGDSCPLTHSYCRKTIKSDGVFAVEDALAAGWEGDPAYELFNLGCYIGTSITVNNELYGTVFFASESPCDEPFTDADRTFVRLMSQLVSYELERDHARTALERQNERLEDFASIVSHDLRNPLNVAEGHLELGRQEHDNEHFERVAQAHGRMNVLIDDLLTLAREGDQAVDLEPIDLATCCEGCWRNVDTANATLHIATEQVVTADRSRLQQLLENLYRNAIEHGGDDVTVTVGELEAGFYVEDDGPGIPSTAHDAAFDLGYSTSTHGTGFGLSIVKQVVNTHGWEIRVTDGEEGGARFEITGVDVAD